MLWETETVFLSCNHGNSSRNNNIYNYRHRKDKWHVVETERLEILVLVFWSHYYNTAILFDFLLEIIFTKHRYNICFICFLVFYNFKNGLSAHSFFKLNCFSCRPSAGWIKQWRFESRTEHWLFPKSGRFFFSKLRDSNINHKALCFKLMFNHFFTTI